MATGFMQEIVSSLRCQVSNNAFDLKSYSDGFGFRPREGHEAHVGRSLAVKGIYLYARPPRRDGRVRDYPLTGDLYAIKIGRFMGSDKVGSHLDLNLHLAAGYGDAAPVRGFANTETSPGIPYVSGTDFELQFTGPLAPYIEISIAAQ